MILDEVISVEVWNWTSPEIWIEQLATIKTNNASENNHSIQSSTIPRHHGLVSEVISYFKHSNAKSSDKFIK